MSCKQVRKESCDLPCLLFKPYRQSATFTECTATLRESFALIMQGALSASLKVLVDLPGLLDFLSGLLKETGNGLASGPGILVLFPSDHLIEFTLCPCRERFKMYIAKGNSEFLEVHEVHEPP